MNTLHYPSLVHDRAMKYVRDSNRIFLESDILVISLVLAPCLELLVETYCGIRILGTAIGLVSAVAFWLFTKFRERKLVDVIIRFGLHTIVLDGGRAYVDNKNCSLTDIAYETYTKGK